MKKALFHLLNLIVFGFLIINTFVFIGIQVFSGHDNFFTPLIPAFILQLFVGFWIGGGTNLSYFGYILENKKLEKSYWVLSTMMVASETAYFFGLFY